MARYAIAWVTLLLIVAAFIVFVALVVQGSRQAVSP